MDGGLRLLRRPERFRLGADVRPFRNREAPLSERTCRPGAVLTNSRPGRRAYLRLPCPALLRYIQVDGRYLRPPPLCCRADDGLDGVEGCLGRRMLHVFGLARAGRIDAGRTVLDAQLSTTPCQRTAAC